MRKEYTTFNAKVQKTVTGKKKIISLKGEEMKELRKSGLLTSVTLTLSPSTSAIAPFFIFLTMTLAGVELDTTQAFTVLSIFNALQFSISTLPLTVRNITEAHISFKRFQEFLGIKISSVYNIHMIFIINILRSRGVQSAQ